jgi:hypothetical protein
MSRGRVRWFRCLRSGWGGEAVTCIRRWFVLVSAALGDGLYFSPLVIVIRFMFEFVFWLEVVMLIKQWIIFHSFCLWTFYAKLKCTNSDNKNNNFVSFRLTLHSCLGTYHLQTPTLRSLSSSRTVLTLMSLLSSVNSSRYSSVSCKLSAKNIKFSLRKLKYSKNSKSHNPTPQLKTNHQNHPPPSSKTPCTKSKNNCDK